jgi:hypothetical protein
MSKVGLLDERPSFLVPIGHDKPLGVGKKKVKKTKRTNKNITQLGKGKSRKNSAKLVGRTKLQFGGRKKKTKGNSTQKKKRKSSSKFQSGGKRRKPSKTRKCGNKSKHKSKKKK